MEGSDGVPRPPVGSSSVFLLERSVFTVKTVWVKRGSGPTSVMELESMAVELSVSLSGGSVH